MRDWAEVHRLFEREGLSKSAISRRLGMTRNTVSRLLALEEPPRYTRPPNGSMLDPHRDAIAAMLGDDAEVPATVPRVWRGALGSLHPVPWGLGKALRPSTMGSRLMTEPGRRALELMDLMKASPGQHVVSDLEGLSLSTYTFETNFTEFNELLKALLRPEMGIQLAALSNQELLQEAQAEVARRLHNFVAAATSLIDHTRIISGRLYEGAPERRAAYQQKVDDTFANDPLSRFIVGLRQYCLHYRLPFIGFVLQLAPKQEEPSHAFSLSRSALLEFDGWSQPAKQFIEESGDRIDFISAGRGYRDRVQAFYEWFESDIRELWASELEELGRYEREYALIELESHVAMAESLPVKSPMRSVPNIFVQLLYRDELEELSTLPTRAEQMSRAIELLMTRLPVPAKLIERLRALI